MILFFTIVLFLYGGLTSRLLWAWKSIKKRNKSTSVELHSFISVIIPVRNEGKNIASLLTDISSQNYPFDKFEVIVVNDSSDDDTVEIVENYVSKVAYDLRLVELHNPKSYSHKKMAITQAIDLAKGEWILTTDGDCRVQSTWLNSFNYLMQNQELHMITGSVFFNIVNGGLLQRIQQIEFASLIGVGASTLQFGVASMCNGANLAYRKSTFETVNGFEGNEHISSGDDEFLLHKVHEAFPGGVCFLKDSESVVFTSAQKSFLGFINQRKRWASKWKGPKKNASKTLAPLVFLFHALWLLLLAACLLGLIDMTMGFTLLISKWLIDFIYLNSLMTYFNKKINIFDFIVLELIYPFYVVFFGMVANFGKYKWKGRNHKL